MVEEVPTCLVDRQRNLYQSIDINDLRLAGQLNPNPLHDVLFVILFQAAVELSRTETEMNHVFKMYFAL